MTPLPLVTLVIVTINICAAFVVTLLLGTGINIDLNLDTRYLWIVLADVLFRFYGAASVCYSCRIFFRRVVTTKQELSCTLSGSCLIDKLSRNHCK